MMINFKGRDSLYIETEVLVLNKRILKQLIDCLKERGLSYDASDILNHVHSELESIVLKHPYTKLAYRQLVTQRQMIKRSFFGLDPIVIDNKKLLDKIKALYTDLDKLIKSLKALNGYNPIYLKN